MKNLMSLFICLFSFSSMAGNSSISCVVQEQFNGKMHDVVVEFVVSELGSPKAKLESHPKAKNEDGYSPIYIKIKGTTQQFSNMDNLNAQGGDLRVGSDRIRLFGDGDGYTFVDLVLFKNSGYKKGYVRVYGSGDQYYQDLNCDVK